MDTDDDWLKGDRVGINIAPEKILIERREVTESPVDETPAVVDETVTEDESASSEAESAVAESVGAAAESPVANEGKESSEEV